MVSISLDKSMKFDLSAGKSQFEQRLGQNKTPGFDTGGFAFGVLRSGLVDQGSDLDLANLASG